VSRSARLCLAAALVLSLAGCAGQVDLSKTVTPRTTVQASGSFNEEALRMVEPCSLLTDEVITSIGKRRSTSAENRTGYSECTMPITDKETGKQTVNLTIKIGADLLSAPKQTSKSVRGLGVYETRGTTSCTQSAITDRDKGIGVVAQVFWESGDPCGAATKLLESSLSTMIQKPPLYPDTPGSLVKLDPCTGFDDATLKSLVGNDVEKSPYGIRSCNFRVRLTYASLEYTIDGDPMTGNSSRKPVKVDVTDKVKGATQYQGLTPNKCYIEWVHRALAGNRGENVKVGFERPSSEPGTDPCVKAMEAARAIAPKLPANG
jgi:hypothetical protein